MKKVKKTFSLNPKVFEALEKKAKQERRSKSQIVEHNLAKELNVKI